MSEQPSTLDKATLGGGCFWCIEAIFEQLDGVQEAVSGYAGGTVENPTYESVCTGQTGHAEVVQIHFDPDRASYKQLLEVFFKAHDPTTLNRQGVDTGTQYRSIILYHDDDQKAAAEKAIAKASTIWPDPVVTELAPLETFHEAEVKHQDYYRNNPGAPYCVAVIAPKLGKF